MREWHLGDHAEHREGELRKKLDEALAENAKLKADLKRLFRPPYCRDKMEAEGKLRAARFQQSNFPNDRTGNHRPADLFFRRPCHDRIWHLAKTGQPESREGMGSSAERRGRPA